jgi:hypothetical protein
MGMANLNFEDQPDGTIRMGAVFVGGYNGQLESHRVAWMALKFLESRLTRLEEPTINGERPDDGPRILLAHS